MENIFLNKKLGLSIVYIKKENGLLPRTCYREGVVFNSIPPENIDESLYDDPTSWGIYPIGYYENGEVFKDPPWIGALPIGNYRDGKIYTINAKEEKLIGEYKDGEIFNITDLSKPVLFYDGPIGGAATLALIWNVFRA